MDIANVALEGLKRAESRLDQVARRIARTGTPEGGGAAAEDTVSLSDNIVQSLDAVHSYEANLRLIHVEDELNRHIIDILG